MHFLLLFIIAQHVLFRNNFFESKEKIQKVEIS